MTPLTQDPTVVIRINPNTKEIVDVANNISPDLKVILVTGATAYERDGQCLGGPVAAALLNLP